MALKAFIGDAELDLPENFSLPSELHSPIYDFKEFRIGDFEMGISFPATPKNRIAFGFADELHQGEKNIKYDNFRMEQAGQMVLAGILSLTDTNTDNTGGSFECDFFTNIFGIDVVNQPLHSIMTKTVNLGSTAAAIVAAAKAQTVANPSTNGITGSVLKFVPTYAPDFYGDTNRDWEIDAQEYRFETEYEPNDHITFRLPEFTQDHPGIPADIPYANLPKVWRNKLAAADGESPFTRTEKWKLRAPGVMNSMMAGTYMQNNDYEKQTNTINRHGLLPSIQVLDVFREIAKALGYTLTGQFMDDGVAQRIFLFSNFALDKTSGSPNYIYVGKIDPVSYGPAITGFIPLYDQFDGIYKNENNLFRAGSPPSFYDGVTPRYVCEASGSYKISVKVRVKNNKASERHFSVEFWDFAAPFAPLAQNALYIPATTLQNVDLNVYLDLEAGKQYHVWIDMPDDIDYEILYTTLEITNLETDFRNIYEGNVSYADHMPDCTVADFIHAFQLWKNLYQGFDPVNKVWRIDFTDSIIKQNADMIELKPYQIPGQNIETVAKRRFELNYANLDDVYEKPANVTELDAVAAVQDLPPPTQPDTCILVRNLHAYYVTKEYDYGGRLFWDFAGYAWYDLKVEAEGDLYDIRPDLGPVPMGRFQAADTYETIGPIYSDAGRSPMYLPGGKRPSIQVMHYLGMQTGVDSQGVPFATVSGYDYFGTKIVDSYAWAEQYPVSWKRTLQMLVLEEIITAHFHLPPSAQQLINFSKLFLLGHVPVIPIRTATEISAGNSGFMEIEARKVKMVDIHIISSDGEPLDPDSEDVNSYYYPYGLSGTIETVEAETFTILLSAPFQGIVTHVGGVLAAGTCAIQCAIDGTPLSGTATAISTTYNEVEHEGDNVITIGDELTLTVSIPAGSPAMLDFVVKMLLIP